MPSTFGADREIAACVAFAQVTDESDAPAILTLNRGFASLTHIEGSGVYDLTFDAGMTGALQDSADLVTQVTGDNNAIVPILTRTYLSPSVLRIRSFNDAGIADDTSFDVKVYRATNHV